MHESQSRKSQIKQIISKGPRELYVVDLVDIKENFNNSNYNSKYIINIIDHYSKLIDSYLLNKKEAKEVLNHINNFISRNGEPSILQCDQGKKFENNLLKIYCKDRNINLLCSGVRHPMTNGMVEVVHKEIISSLLAEKLEKNKNYDINFAISNAVRAHNINIHTVTKFSQEYLFHHNTKELTNEIEKNMLKSQIHRKKDNNPILPKSQVLISTRYVIKCNQLSIKFGKNGKRIIPGIVDSEGSRNNYPISVSIDFNELERGDVYNVDYRLVKEVTDKDI